jgi:hypothetical protein
VLFFNSYPCLIPLSEPEPSEPEPRCATAPTKRCGSGSATLFRLLAGALCYVNVASGDGPLKEAAKRTAGTAHIVVLKDRLLHGKRKNISRPNFCEDLPDTQSPKHPKLKSLTGCRYGGGSGQIPIF